MKRLALFASGTGTNAEAIINYFSQSNSIQVVALLCDRKQAPVLEKARVMGIPAVPFSGKEFYESDEVLNLLIGKKTDLVVLAGFLKLVPKKIIDQFPGKIINIHPALLPKHGGKDMYGMKVHEAVYQNHEKETGITIHYVNENFDEGEIIFQKKITLEATDSPKEISEKVRKLELEWYSKIIEKLLN